MHLKSVVIKWDAARHFGFLANPILSERDIFVHQSSLVGRQRLMPGEEVEFDLTTNAKGKIAVNVVVVEKAVQPATLIAAGNSFMKETTNEQSAKQ